MKNDMKKRILSAHLALILLLMLWCGTYFETKESQRQMEQLKASQSESGASNAVKVKRKLMYKAMHTPLGKYPETVTYTLGKIAGANNSNLPVGDTYENNAYTRYLKKILNIQNEDVFELQDGNTYEEAVNVAIEDRDIPDVLVVKGRDNLLRLIEAGLIEELTETYEECTTDTIKEMYESYGDSLLQSATVDGKLYAFPNTVIDDGTPLLWLRKDWIEKLGLKEPETVGEALEVIRAFVEQDAAGDGQTIGLACSTDVVAGADQTYGVDATFIHAGAMPCHWILDKNGNVVYGSVTQETKEALLKLHNLYEDEILDQRFLLRKTENIDDLLKTGHCGAIYGRWWAPNNPLSAAYNVDSNAEWKPYLLDKEQVNETQKISVFESYDQWMYVVARSSVPDDTEKSSVYAGLRTFGEKSGNEKVKIHGSGSFFVDDTIHDGAEQKSFFLGWFLWIFQNIIDVFYLFPEIFFRDCFRQGGGCKHAVQFFLQALPFFGEPFFVCSVFLQCINPIFKSHLHAGFADGQMVKSLLQPLDGLIVFLLLLSIADCEGEVHAGKDIIEVAVDGPLCFGNCDRVGAFMEAFCIFPALKVRTRCAPGRYRHRSTAYGAL